MNHLETVLIYIKILGNVLLQTIDDVIYSKLQWTVSDGIYEHCGIK